ncbi:MAG: DUF1761 domain-containing protein [Paracoccaceae bacterium]
MEVLNVIVAAAAAYVFGAVWYMKLAEPWMAAAGIEKGPDGRPKGAGNPMPYVISAISLLVVAGMMRHVFGMASIDSVGKGIAAGFGLGAFVATPWIVTNYAYSSRPRNLTLIDSGFATIGCTIIGLVLSLF